MREIAYELRVANICGFIIALLLYLAIFLALILHFPFKPIMISETKMINMSLTHFNTTASEAHKANKPKPKKQEPSPTKPHSTLPKPSAESSQSNADSSSALQNTTPNVESKSARAGEVDAYIKYVYELVAKAFKRYASGNAKGEVVLGFSIDMQGGIHDVKILQSSGNKSMDNLAILSLQSIKPKPPHKPYNMLIALKAIKER